GHQPTLQPTCTPIGLWFSHTPHSLTPPPILPLHAAEQGQGLEFLAALVMRSGHLFLDLEVNNRATNPVQHLAVQLNKNTLGLVPQQQQMSFEQPIATGLCAS
ncbi:unnamed protein product, partial [Discosporangium mesarthrocarpum]